MTTRLLFLPDDQTAIELETHLGMEEVEEKVRTGLWSPPAACSRQTPAASSRLQWRAIRQGQRVIILPAAMPEADHPSVHLSPRQHEVLAGLAEGLTLKELALRMHISLRTLCQHISAIKQRLGTVTLAQSISRAVALGIYPPAKKPDGSD
jgi:DNA-binding CsgD family transcriptional regulator